MGPYLSERQWGTQRRLQPRWRRLGASRPGPHRAYRCEDGIAGISDDEQRLCSRSPCGMAAAIRFSERLFGLTNAEGNHGEDVKEPTTIRCHADAPYLKMLTSIRRRTLCPACGENRTEARASLSSNLTPGSSTTTAISMSREYAKAGPNDVLMQVSSTAVQKPRFTCCRSSGSATPGRGSRKRRAPTCISRPRA